MPSEKTRCLHLVKIFEEETDDDHGLSTPQLIEKLAERGLSVERKTLYDDIKSLQNFGYDIQSYQRHPVEYGLATRKFQAEELMLMADAVQSSKFLTERKANNLVSLIGELGGKSTSDTLKKRIHVEGRIKSQNESVFYALNAIQTALCRRKKSRLSIARKALKIRLLKSFP